MSARVMGIASALPEGRLAQERAAAIAERLSANPHSGRAIRALYRRSGVLERRSVLADAEGGLPFYERDPEHDPTTGERMALYEAHAPLLAEEAAREACARAGAEPSDITHIITASCTGFCAPGIDLALVERMGLGRAVQRTHIGFMGCHAAINALRAARDAAIASPGARVLVVCVELCTLHFHRDAQEGAATANALFGDGAAAVVVGSGAGCHGPELRSCSSVVLPGTADKMGWRIGDTGFRMMLDASVPERFGRAAAPWIDGWLGGLGLARSGVGSWVVHPGGPRILGAVGEALGVPEADLDRSRSVLRERGNMSSATVLAILEGLLAEKRLGGGPVAMLAFGPGLVGEAALLV